MGFYNQHGVVSVWQGQTPCEEKAHRHTEGTLNQMLTTHLYPKMRCHLGGSTSTLKDTQDTHGIKMVKTGITLPGNTEGIPVNTGAIPMNGIREMSDSHLEWIRETHEEKCVILGNIGGILGILGIQEIQGILDLSIQTSEAHSVTPETILKVEH